MFKSSLTGFVAASAVVFTITGGAAIADTLKMVSAFSPNQANYRIILESFVTKVAEKTGGDTDFSVVGPEAINPLELVEPLQTGIIDLIFTHAAYHAGTTKIGMAADGIRVNPSAWRENGITDAFDAYYQTIGLKMIAIAPLGERGFRFVTKEAVDGKEHSFDGMKVRANASYLAIIEKMGGSPVPLSGGEIYSSLQNGVIDAAPWSATGLVDFKLFEVSSHVLQPDFGSLSNLILMNLDKWNSLDAVTQTAITEAAMETEVYSYEEMTRIADSELTQLQELGMAITHMNENEVANIDDWMAQAMWELAIETSPEVADGIRSIARAAGLTK